MRTCAARMMTVGMFGIILGLAGMLYGQTPVIHWALDGTATNSGSGGATYDATLVNSPGYTNGVIGSGGLDLVKDSNQCVSVGYTLPDQGTIALWYYVRSYYNYHTIFDNSVDPDDWEMWIYSDGRLRFRADNGSGDVTYDLDNLNGTNHWYHIAVSWDRTGSATLYVNGTARGSDAIGAWVNPGATFYVGGGNNGDLHTGDGIVDDVRIYNTELAASDIRALFGSSTAFYLPLDGDGSDLAPGGDNPAVLAGSPSFVEGLVGQALELNAPGEYAQVDYHLPEQGSVSFWHYKASPFANYDSVFDNSVEPNDWEMWTDVNGFVRARVNSDAGPSGYLSYDLDDLNGADHWYHFVYTWDRPGDVAAFYINGTLRGSSQVVTGWVDPGRYFNLGGGNAGNNTRNGLWDEVRVFNRPITAPEVRELFGQVEAVYLPLDDDVIDRVGGDNTAALSGDPQYVAGIVGKALDCDGNGDNAGIPYHLPEAGTIALWYYAQGPWYNFQTVFDNSVNPEQWEMWIYDSGLLRFRIAGTVGLVSYDLDDLAGPNTWYHIGLTWDRSADEVKLYVNGTERDSDTIGAGWIEPGATVYMGGGNPGNMKGNGIWDEVHIYNRALEGDEISELTVLPKGTLFIVR